MSDDPLAAPKGGGVMPLFIVATPDELALANESIVRAVKAIRARTGCGLKAAAEAARGMVAVEDRDTPPDPRDVEIAALRAEVARLRDALRAIADHNPMTMDRGWAKRIAIYAIEGPRHD